MANRHYRLGQRRAARPVDVGPYRVTHPGAPPVIDARTLRVPDARLRQSAEQARAL